MARFKFGSKDASGNAKNRAILFFVVLILVVGLIVGYLIYRRHTGMVYTASLANAPSIESIPGAGQASSEYVKLQEQQNLQQAQQAAQQGTSAVPTITRTNYMGPSEFQTTTTTRPGCSQEELRRAREAGVRVEELRCKGCDLNSLRAAGFSAGDMAAAGYSATDQKNAGFSPADLRQAGFTPSELKSAGLNAAQLASAGFTPNELAKAGYTARDIANAGFPPNILAASGIGTRPSPNTPKDCSPESLKQARAQNVSAADLRKLGCGASALRAAGYSAPELKLAGFTPEELRAAGFTPASLRDATFTAGQLRRAGVSPADLKSGGFTPVELKNAGFSPLDLKNAGFTPADLKAAGYTNGDMVRAGFNPGEVGGGTSAVVAPAQLAAANAQLTRQCNIDALRQARAQGISAADLRNRGCSLAALLAAGFTPAELKAAGFTDDDLKAAGLTPAQIAATPGVAGLVVIPPLGNTEQQLAQLQATQELQMNQQQRDQRLGQVQTSMASQANALFGTWTPPATQEFVQGAQAKDAAAGTQATTTTTNAGASTVTTTTSAMSAVPAQGYGGGYGRTPEDNCAYIKAGDITMAVLTTTVNSDEESPVMADIVSGKLRGAKLIGKFTLLKEKVLISFNKLSLPGQPSSIGINAVAIDPDTAKTALADCVDTHAWLRYGTLFASSFLSGLADAISQQGSQTSTGAGGILVTHDPLSVGQTVAVALGAVGSQYASVLGSNFTRPPTVMVYSGDSIGILFMQDISDIKKGCPCKDDDRTCGSAAGMGTCVTHY